jgi:phosphomannomutase
MSTKEKIFLFDMDGTLTPPRCSIESDMISAISRLTSVGRVGIITGSDMEYVRQQVFSMFEGWVDPNQVDILPCNGTKKYTYKNKEYVIDHEAKMIDKITRETYNTILRLCSRWQFDIMTEHKTLPFTGTFLQYRGSLLNWCPIGRSAGINERNTWVDVDEKHGIRSKFADLLQSKMRQQSSDITVALGGATSLDIYPAGWDKTYGLKHYGNFDVYFTGDKCMVGGNDFHIYEKLKESGKSFSVQSPKDTITQIENFIQQS